MDGSVDEMKIKACFSGLPNRYPLAGLELEAWPICSLESTGTGGGGVDEMQNKAETQPAWLELAAGAKLSLAI